MLWFRLGGIISLCTTSIIALGVLCSVLVMCINPNNDRAMDTDPYYNGTLFFYVVVILAEMSMVAATGFGFFLSFKVWKNNLQLDHTLRRLFTIWLSVIGIATIIMFLIGIIGMVRYREPQEEIVTLYEIFSKYNQDIKFIGSFERFQREHSCCGITGANDWFASQYKAGNGMEMAMAGMGGMDMFGGFGMGSPTTGKCHLTMPTIPLGCGKKMIEIIHYTMVVYSGIVLLETIASIASAVFAWYCFFYWIEKEVIIIPEDEVSNLIVIEPESSTSTNVSSLMSTSIPKTWSSQRKFSGRGSQYIQYTRPENRMNESRYEYNPGSYVTPSINRDYPASRSRYNQEDYGGSRRSYMPNTRRQTNESQFANFYGPIPAVGGPSVQYQYPDRSEGRYSRDQYEDEYHYSNPRNSGPSRRSQDPGGSRESDNGRTRSRINPRNTRDFYENERNMADRSRDLNNGYYSQQGRPESRPDYGRRYPVYEESLHGEPVYEESLHGEQIYEESLHGEPNDTESGQPLYYPVPNENYNDPPEKEKSHHGRPVHPEPHYGGSDKRHKGPFGGSSGGRFSSSIASRFGGIRSYFKGGIGGSGGHFGSSHHDPKKKHSFNHILHKQEKAMGGKVIGEMHVDHKRDPDLVNQNNQMDIAKGKHGHRSHHASIAVVKNKKTPQPKALQGRPMAGHGQTGHLAEDIIQMSGAPGVKSLLDDINLPVEHGPEVTYGKGYLHKLRHAHRKKSQPNHPDHAHPGHGPVRTKGGKLAAPSVDGSQLQCLVDDMLKPKPKPKPAKSLITPHDIKEPKKDGHDPGNHHENHHHEHSNKHNHSPNNHIHSHNNHHHHSPHHHEGSLRTQVIFKNPQATE